MWPLHSLAFTKQCGAEVTRCQTSTRSHGRGSATLSSYPAPKPSFIWQGFDTSVILRHGGSALWALISTQQGWLSDCAEAFDWMYQQVSGSTTLRHPKDDWESWCALMTGRPKRFGSLVQRAWKHEMIQSYNTHIVEEGYNDFAEAMDLANFDFPDFAVQTMEAYEEHICLQCQRTFGSRTG